MKRLLFIAVLSISTCVYSQNIAFEQALPLPPEPQITSNLIRVINGCSDFADVDGDNDQDLFITGEGEPINNSFYSHSQMYLNDGAGNFLAVVSPFDSVAFGSVAFADVDGDNDNDLLITGHYYYTTPFSTSLHKVAKLYANDGSGNFVEVTGTPFEPISFSSIDFADIDGDNDLDLLISGENLSNTNIIKLYVNDGLGNFTEVIGTPFSQYGGGKVSFSDIDGDNDQDLLLFNAGKLYTNDGLGNFTEVIGTPFLPITGGDLAFGDIDGDSDQDLLTTGTASWASVKLYTNDGLGNFTEVIGTNWAVPTPMGGSRIAFSDIDGDNDLDFVITHCAVPSGGSATVLYINDGLGNFTAVSPSPFNNQYSDYLNFCDINSDGDKDLLILGDGSWGSAKLYENDGNGIFREAVGSPFVGLYKSTIAFADIDNDNDIDVAISGTQVTGEQETKLYRNDGLGNFTEIIGTNLISGQHPYVAFSDVDSDNDQDLLILGMANWNWFLTRVYLNDGLGNFSPPFQSALVGGNGTGSQLLLGDIDNDGDEDLLINDILYSNDGLGAFTMVAGTPFFGLLSTIAADFADIDGDNDLDLILTGTNISGSGEAKLYTNDGLGNFTEVIGTPFIGVRYGAVAFADIDNDGDEDLFISGSMGGTNYASKVYTNDGLGNFTEVIGTSFIGVSKGSVTFTDVDNDNDLDLLIAGKTLDSTKTRLYTNDGLGNFTELSNMPFDGIEDGGIASADIDGDNDQDIMIIGEIVPSTNEYHYITKLYRNLLYTSTNYIDYNIDQICNIYPNPSEDVFNIILKSKEKQNLQLRVLNMLGEEVYTENLKGFVGNYTKQIMLGEYPDAIYLLEIRTSEGIVNKKLILQ